MLASRTHHLVWRLIWWKRWPCAVTVSSWTNHTVVWLTLTSTMYWTQWPSCGQTSASSQPRDCTPKASFTQKLIFYKSKLDFFDIIIISNSYYRWLGWFSFRLITFFIATEVVYFFCKYSHCSRILDLFQATTGVRNY